MAPDIAFAGTPDGVAVNLYMTGCARVPVPGGQVVLSMQSEFPRVGYARLTIEAGDLPAGTPLALDLRVPGYAEHFAVLPGGDPTRDADRACRAPTCA